jgi:predicted N-formylglutamate amidohydrolase
MEYIIELSEHKKYLICRVNEPITTAMANEYTMDLDRMSHETGIKRFLIDVRNAKNIMSTIDNYDYAHKEMEEMKLQKDVRAAILAVPDDHSHDFFELAGQNEGYNIRIFRAEEEAIAWLTE